MVEDNKLYEEYIKIAKKYIPKLTRQNKGLIMALSKCPNYNGVNAKLRLQGRNGLPCFCSLDLLVNVAELKQGKKL